RRGMGKLQGLLDVSGMDVEVFAKKQCVPTTQYMTPEHVYFRDSKYTDLSDTAQAKIDFGKFGWKTAKDKSWRLGDHQRTWFQELETNVFGWPLGQSIQVLHSHRNHHAFKVNQHHARAD